MGWFETQGVGHHTAGSVDSEGQQFRRSRPRKDTSTCSTKSDVAAKFADELAAMSRDELLDVIAAGRLPLLSEEALSRLRSADRHTLERVAHLARRVCRRQGY